MSKPAVMPKSEILRRSMRCFSLGWWSLIPLLGIVPAIVAFMEFRAVGAGARSRWNAAHVRLLVGVCLAGAGILLTLILGTLIALAIINNTAHGNSNYGGGYQNFD
jgi:hypothetical protein